ncbi:SAM-dependent methyltransferase [Streptomyces sp. NPDC048595]|uniref:SAM-dependent methyltransferase n=1 Tax=Streptomyces sp. NPDC048595 TaxID=3365576 RepID=UPI00371C3CA3
MSQVISPRSPSTTALWVAWARAVEHRRPDRLFADDLAAAFLAAAGAEAGTPPAEFREALPVAVATRTAFFDEHLRSVTAGGIRQVVLLGAGLDTRAFRLPWPAETSLYEFDTPELLAFKETVLDRQGAAATCRRTPLAIDLTGDWPALLCAAGLDPGQPVAWLAEGLLPYLEVEAADRLLTEIGRLSAPGSTLALTYNPGALRTLASAPGGRHLDRVGVAHPALPSHPQPWLARHGWQAHAHDIIHQAVAHRRAPAAAMERTSPGTSECWLVTATIPGQQSHHQPPQR